MDVSICLVEIVATYVENSVILASVICSSGNKYTGKKTYSYFFCFQFLRL